MDQANELSSTLDKPDLSAIQMPNGGQFMSTTGLKLTLQTSPPYLPLSSLHCLVSDPYPPFSKD